MKPEAIAPYDDLSTSCKLSESEKNNLSDVMLDDIISVSWAFKACVTVELNSGISNMWVFTRQEVYKQMLLVKLQGIQGFGAQPEQKVSNHFKIVKSEL